MTHGVQWVLSFWPELTVISSLIIEKTSIGGRCFRNGFRYYRNKYLLFELDSRLSSDPGLLGIGFLNLKSPNIEFTTDGYEKA